MKRLLRSLLALALFCGGCASQPKRDFTPALARFFLESSDQNNPLVTLPHSGVKLSVGATPLITETDITNVELVQVDLGRCLLFQLSPSASRDLYRSSTSNQGRRLVLFIDGVALGARRIEAPLTNGAVYVFVEVPDESLPALVSRLRKTTAELQLALTKRG
jgi:hypothetical protein